MVAVGDLSPAWGEPAGVQSKRKCAKVVNVWIQAEPARGVKKKSPKPQEKQEYPCCNIVEALSVKVGVREGKKAMALWISQTKSPP